MAAATLAVALSSLTLAQDGIEYTGDSEPNVAGEASWDARSFRRAVADCRLPTLPAGKSKGKPEPCIWEGVVLRSTAPRPMLCVARAQIADSAAAGELQRVETRDVLYPEERIELQVLRQSANLELRTLTTACELVPRELPPSPPSTCDPGLRPIYLEPFYPPRSRRDNEQGQVVIDYGIRDGRAVDLTLLVSSGFPALDRAALKLMSSVRAQQDCAGERFRKTINFQLRED